jgi:vacuolar-type H+-ATPase subunit E/Vma4
VSPLDGSRGSAGDESRWIVQMAEQEAERLHREAEQELHLLRRVAWAEAQQIVDDAQAQAAQIVAEATRAANERPAGTLTPALDEVQAQLAETRAAVDAIEARVADLRGKPSALRAAPPVDALDREDAGRRLDAACRLARTMRAADVARDEVEEHLRGTVDPSEARVVTDYVFRRTG